MRKKIIGFLICLVLISTSIPFVGAIPINSDNEKPTNNFIIGPYIGSYIEASGIISHFDFPRIIGSNFWKSFWFRPFRDDRAFVSYWHILFDKTADIALYSEENGDLLWQNPGEDHTQMRIIGFFGTYIPENDNGEFHAVIEGRALIVFNVMRPIFP
jgi:hypothetical protein